jgi:FKBP-type peptidyl-prolyl cis-trans isomerase
MVLVRRKDKRRGNEAEEIAVASDSSIVANKGVRSLQSARTGRFAADMRVQVGGYGRADKTWGVDHPWHKTREEIVDGISMRDHMEEGLLVKEEPRPQGQGLSRAALKKKKKKMKNGGLTESTGGSEMGSEAPSAVVVNEPMSNMTAKKEEKKEEPSTEKLQSKEEVLEEKLATTGGTAGSKKRKRVNRNKKKLEKTRANGGDVMSDDDNDSDVDTSVVEVAKPKSKKQKQKETSKAAGEPKVTKQDVLKQHHADATKREAIAAQYDTAFGNELTTASGLEIRDVRLGKGRVPAVGEMITVRYRGRIDDKNGIVFGKGMLSTTYGTGSVIAGWEEGMGTMRAGGIRHLTVPPSLAYGNLAKGTKIPANATLFFEVELVRMGKRQRDTISKDEIPLPSAFQRKKSPSASAASKGAKNSKPNDAALGKKGKNKRRRRKFSI